MKKMGNRYVRALMLVVLFSLAKVAYPADTETAPAAAQSKPPVDQDIVYIHISAEGWIAGELKRKEFVRAYRPIELYGQQRTAIAWTTSASVAAVIELMQAGTLPARGFVPQETIPLDGFLATKTGRLYT